VRLLLQDQRVMVNEPDNDGGTPLRYAASEGHHDVVKWWIVSGREMDLGTPGDIYKTDAIGTAKGEKKTEVVRLLERFKSDATKTRNEVRLELGITNGKSLSLIFLFFFSFYGANFFQTFQESALAIALNVPCNIFATSVPDKFVFVSEITSLFLPYSNFTILPESLGLLFLFLFFPFFSFLISPPCLASFTGLVELDISHNPLGDSAVPLLVSIIRANKTLTTLRYSPLWSLFPFHSSPSPSPFFFLS